MIDEQQVPAQPDASQSPVPPPGGPRTQAAVYPAAVYPQEPGRAGAEEAKPAPARAGNDVRFEEAHRRWGAAFADNAAERAREALGEMRRALVYRWRDQVAHDQALRIYEQCEQAHLRAFARPAAGDVRSSLWA